VNSCGDWLAVALKDPFRTGDGSFDLAAFKACLKDNGVTPPNVNMNRHGAIGRFRMCAKVSHVVIGGKKIVAPGTKKRGRKVKTTAAAS
jgi:hypothetical protein